MPPNPSILDTVDAIAADPTLTPTQKAQNIASAKAVAWRSAIMGVGVMPQTWTFTERGATWEVTITEVRVDGATIVLEGKSTRNGAPWVVKGEAPIWPIMISNPPTLMPDAAGAVVRNGRNFSQDIIGLARHLIARALTGE